MLPKLCILWGGFFCKGGIGQFHRREAASPVSKIHSCRLKSWTVYRQKHYGRPDASLGDIHSTYHLGQQQKKADVQVFFSSSGRPRLPALAHIHLHQEPSGHRGVMKTKFVRVLWSHKYSEQWRPFINGIIKHYYNKLYEYTIGRLVKIHCGFEDGLQE